MNNAYNQIASQYDANIAQIRAELTDAYAELESKKVTLDSLESKALELNQEKSELLIRRYEVETALKNTLDPDWAKRYASDLEAINNKIVEIEGKENVAREDYELFLIEYNNLASSIEGLNYSIGVEERLKKEALEDAGLLVGLEPKSDCSCQTKSTVTTSSPENKKNYKPYIIGGAIALALIVGVLLYKRFA